MTSLGIELLAWRFAASELGRAVDRRATTRRQPLASQRIGSNYPRIDSALLSFTYLSSTSATTVFTMAESELTPKFAPFIGMVSGWLVGASRRLPL